MRKMNLLEVGEYLDSLNPRGVLFDSGEQGCLMLSSAVRVILDMPKIRVSSDMGRIYISDERNFMAMHGVRKVEVEEDLQSKCVELFAYCDDPDGFSPYDYIKMRIVILL